MPINPNISLQVHQPEGVDVMGSIGKAMSLAEMSLNNQQRRQMMQQQEEAARIENENRLAAQREQDAIRRELLKGGASDWKETIDGLRRNVGTPTAVKYASDLETALSERKKDRLESEAAELDIAAKKAGRLGSLAGSIQDDSSLAFALRQAVTERLLPKEQAAEMLAASWDEAMKAKVSQFAQQALTVAQQAEQRLKEIQEKRAATAAPFQKRKLEAETIIAERTAKEGPQATGEVAEFKQIFAPGYFQSKGIEQPTAEDTLKAYKEFQASKRQLVPGRDIPLPPAVEDQRKRMEASRAANSDGLSPAQQSRIQVIASQFDNYQPVKNFNETANKAESVKQIINAGVGGPGDLAVVFEFMKGLDPTSVVRESEYATAAKSGNLFRGVMAKYNGYFKEEGGFLPERVKQDFLKILNSKLDVSAKQVKSMYKDRARRIDEITGKPGTGEKYLTDYTTILGDQSAPGGAEGGSVEKWGFDSTGKLVRQ